MVNETTTSAGSGLTGHEPDRRPRTAGLFLPLLIALLLGCRSETPRSDESTVPENSASAPTGAVRLGVVDDSPLAEAIKREWLAQSQGEIDVTPLARDQFSLSRLKDFDVLVCPTNWLGELAAAKVIRPLPTSVRPGHISNELDYDWNDIFELVRREELRWGNAPYAVPFGSPQLLLAYRTDLFQQWNLTVPETWQAYDETVREVAGRIRQPDGDSRLQSPFATAEPWGADWAARTLLARSASYACHRNQVSTLFQFTSFDPLINRASFVRGLTEMRAAVEYQPSTVLEMSPGDVMREMLEGRLVMGLTWPTTEASAGESARFGSAIGFAALPGSHRVFHRQSGEWQTRGEDEAVSVPLLGIDGRIGVISRHARSRESAASFLLWLTNNPQSQRISTRGAHTTLFRNSQVASAEQWVANVLQPAAGDYAAVLAKTQSRPAWLMLLRIPGQRKYLAALDESLRAETDQSPQALLDAVAQEWSRIATEFGVENQRKAYHRSLGLDL